MARFAEDKKKRKKKRSSSKAPHPIFMHVKPTLSNSSFSSDVLQKPVSTAKKPLMGSVEHSTLLIPAVVVVPSISGVSCKEDRRPFFLYSDESALINLYVPIWGSYVAN